MKKNRRYSEYGNHWMYFYFGWHFRLSYETCGYFDARHRINISLIFFRWTIILPIWSKHIDECDPPEWGIAIHNNKFWLYKGGRGNMKGGNKWWTFTMPWDYDWIRTSNLRKDGTWEHETKKTKGKNFWDEKWKEVLWSETYPYTYVLKSKEVQHRFATLRVEEREWRQRWLKWTSLFAQTRMTINIDFNDEVGEQTGSWKGGCTGCSYEIRHGELPEQTLRRMERERKF